MRSKRNKYREKSKERSNTKQDVVLNEQNLTSLQAYNQYNNGMMLDHYNSAADQEYPYNHEERLDTDPLTESHCSMQKYSVMHSRNQVMIET